MGDELRGENLVHLNVRFSTETELKKIQDFLYEKSGQGVSFTGLVEAVANEVTIVTAVHNIKSNKGSRTAGVDKMKMDKYLQMPKDELILLIQSSFRNYRPKPARREYIEKSNGKKRPLGIPTVLDRIIQECVRIIIEPICEARFYPQSYGFRPYRAQKHAIRGIINVINAGCKSPDQPVWAIEGDIKGCFDNINHRLLLQKLWRIGIHDKRVLKIISQMLKAGYMENDLFHATELGTPQGGILSPLLSNVYLNDFDWYVGRMYMEPHRQCKHKGNDTRRLKWAGVTPKYNYRYADDWVILTSTEKEALRLKRVLTKYFRNRMKLELSQEKTYVTDLRTNGIHFLGFVVKAERKRKTPDPATWTKHLVGKPLPDMERLGKKIKKLLEEVHRIELCQKVNVQAAQIQYVNSVIVGMAQYLQTSICSRAYHAIDRRVNNAALAVWKKLYPKRYNSIHNADTEGKKADLFSKVRSGKVRVLLGSTAKMGAGTNVQTLLVAVHHLDVGWRPSDMTQRNGRIIRQGNKNKQVYVYNYVTEGTFDAYLWQTLENKQKFISQIMTSKSPMRSCDDVDEQALSYAEVKALCAGDPRIREKMDLDVQVAKLKVLRSDYQNQKYRLEDKLLKHYPEEIQKAKNRIAALKNDAQIADAHPQDKENFCGMTIKGMVFDEKKAAGERLMLACKEMPNADMMLLGTYRGFELNIRFDSFKNEHQIVLRGELSYPVPLGDDPRGNIVRLDNAIGNFADRIADADAALDSLEQQKQAAEVEIAKPFAQEEELQTKSARLAELDALLNMEHQSSRTEPEAEEKPDARPSVLAALEEKADKVEPVRPFKSYLDKDGDAR